MRAGVGIGAVNDRRRSIRPCTPARVERPDYCSGYVLKIAAASRILHADVIGSEMEIP